MGQPAAHLHRRQGWREAGHPVGLHLQDPRRRVQLPGRAGDPDFEEVTEGQGRPQVEMGAAGCCCRLAEAAAPGRGRSGA